MRWAFSVVVAVHGLIHLMGFAKAFGLVDLPQLTQPISRTMGLAWLAASLLTLGSVAALLVWPRGLWVVGALAIVVSQSAIVMAWRDARFGTIANVVLLVVVAHAFLTWGPWSFRAEYEEGIEAGLARHTEARIVTEADLVALPDPVQRYLRMAGVVGRARVSNYRIRFSGRIRSGPGSGWMPFEADQQSFVDEPTRLFWMRATMKGLPVEAFHVLRDGHATMRVRAVGAIGIVDAGGPVMDRSETVTLFNDMCILAPGSLLAPGIVWEAIDARRAKARFTSGGNTIEATLFFDEQGLLENFVSDDRSRSSEDGKSFTQLRFSTPVRNYGSFGAFRIARHGEARWQLPEGDFAYGEFEILDAVYDVR